MRYKNVGTSPNLLTDRFIAAAYLNMARHNVFLTLNSISQKLGKRPLESDAEIRSSAALSSLSGSPDEAQKAIRHLSHCFGFLKPFEDEYIKKTYWEQLASSPKPNKSEKLNRERMAKEEKAVPNDIAELFKLLFEQLNKLRNGFSHFENSEPVPKEATEFDAKLMHCMKTLFDDARRRVKVRMQLGDKDLAFLDRMKKVHNKFKENDNFKFKFDCQKQHLTEAGLIFFICMFLERKYSNELLAQYSAYKGLKENEKSILREVFTQYCIRIPNLRIDSEINENLLYLDMLGELQRCPSILFDCLSQANRDEFRVLADEEDMEIPPMTHLKRYQERFEYFVMRYIDEGKIFRELRFMVDLGNYHFDAYFTEIAGERRLRRLTQKLIGFGRLQDFSTEKIAEKYKGLVMDPTQVDENYDKPYIVKTTPHYHMYEDNIALRLSNNPSTNDPLFPNIVDHTKARNRPSRENLKPHFYVSRYEMLAIGMICCFEKGGEKIEIELKKYINNFNKFLDDIKAGRFTAPFKERIEKREYLVQDENDQDWKEWLSRKDCLNDCLKDYPGLTADRIPTDLRDYFMGIASKPPEKSAIERLKRLIKQTELRQERIKRDTDPNNKSNKIGSRKERLVLAGQLGIFLAEDMMFFQPPSKEAKAYGKATGLKFQVLEAALSQFKARKKEIAILLKDCNLSKHSGAPNYHPFIDDVAIDSCRGVVDFYVKYLEVRLNYLKKIESTSRVLDHHWLTHKKAKRDQHITNDFVKKLAERYSGEPINMPRGFFTSLLKDLLINKGEHKPKFVAAITENQEREPNVSYMIQQWYKHVLDDSPQPFYAYKRAYRVFDQYFSSMKNQKQFAKVESKYQTVEEMKTDRPKLDAWANSLSEKDKNGVNQKAAKKSAIREMDKNEKNIRLCKSQDMVLFLLAKEKIKKSADPHVLGANLDQVKLNSIAPDRENSFFATPIDYSVELFYCLSNDRGKPVSEIRKRIYQKGLKIKNYGDFRRFVKDRRLGNLLNYPYFNSLPEVERSTVEQEIEYYDRNRLKVFKHVLDFERAIIEAYSDFDISSIEHGQKHRAILNFYFERTGNANDNLMEQMIAVRNAFAHNQFPASEYLPTEHPNGQRGFAEAYAEFAERTYGEFAASLNKRTR